MYKKGVIICIIVQGTLFYEHVHVIDENIKLKGPRMEPRGNPFDRGIHFLLALPNVTHCLRFDR